MTRFSDEQLHELSQQFGALTERVENLDGGFKSHIDQEEDDRKMVLHAIHTNTKAVENLTSMVEAHREETQEVVQAFNSAKGAVKVGAAAGKFVKWAGGFAFLGGFVHWLINHGPKV